MDQVRALFDQQDVTVTLVALLLLLVVALMAPRVRARATALNLAFLVIMAVVVAVTVPPSQGWGQLSDAQFLTERITSCFTPKTWFTLQGLQYVDVLLFVLPGLLLTLTTRRPIISLLALSAFTAGIEAWQAYSGAGACRGSDWIAGTLGVIIGVVVGITVLNRGDQPA
ncbi:hypothetical protein GCM10022223_58070 [Kineosporia mesophila]|uniref:VanZ-like domain-containing protein n=1 Tax=Kineosporia mesophila TaxID=566012 RepID=A0ABP7AI08_9ACTN|nr:VanZ family protein [Kineosporia mesophila]MCD5350830.1 VanZ family protein [Kineosporia mesophila]